jgi:hypothetical protein
MPKRRDLLLLLAMIVVAVWLRAPLVHTGITIDDACTAYVIEAGDFSDFVNRIKTIEMSPPLYFLTLGVVTRLFGLTTTALALTSLVLSILSIPAIYWMARTSCAFKLEKESAPDEGKTSAVALSAAFFATVSLLAIVYSHEARTYALAGLLMTCTLALYMPFFDGKASIGRRVILFVSTALLAYTHYTAVAYIGIMSLTALIFRRNGKSRSLAAIPPMVAGLATLIPWYPILKYHSSVGTPWADKTPFIQFLKVFITNASAAVPLPVVPAYLFLNLIAPALIALNIVLKPQAAKAHFQNFLHSPKLFTLVALFFYSASVFGFITPYIFGYVRYMYPIACTAWVLLAFLTCALCPPWPKKKLLIAAGFVALIGVAVSAHEVAGIASEDRSGLRRLANDITAGKFKKTSYITTPDFVGIILVYYLKHECGLSDSQLPDILGFAYPAGGKLPPKHEGRAACWQDPKLIDNYGHYIDEMKGRGVEQIVLIRDTYTPTSQKIPTAELTDKLEALLRSKMRQDGPTQTYSGHFSSYLVTRFVFALK